MEMKIDFLCIGAQKSGTSWLYKNLQEIKEFSLPQVKEIHYFDRDSQYPSPTKKSFIKRISNPKHVIKALGSILKSILQGKIDKAKFVFKWNFAREYNDNWYLSLFNNLEGYKGEITPSYSILNLEDIKEMHKLLPGVKLVLMLRNPIERAWSHYRSDINDKFRVDVNNINSIEIIEFMKTDGQVLRSNYLRTIKNYLEVFEEDQILIGFYDAIKNCPEDLIKDIINHICGENSIDISHLNLNEITSISRNKIDCPKEVLEYLKEVNYYQIKELSDEYGGYFTKWYNELYTEDKLNKHNKIPSTIKLEKA